MDLDERKLKILACIVNNYVLTGEPVSSKQICDSLDIQISSATVRNEMASLTSMGLLVQLHTSSGRIPSRLGYKVFINKIMKKRPLPVYERQRIDEALLSSVKDPDSLLKGALQILAEMTKCAAASVIPSKNGVTIRNIRLVQISPSSAMVILVTSSGMIKNRVFCCDYNLNDELINVFQKILNSKFLNVCVKDVTRAFIQTVAASIGELAFMMTPVLMATFESLKDATDAQVKLEGKVNLLFVPEFRDESIYRILNFLDESKGVADMLLKNNNRSIQVLIGPESKEYELDNLSVIISRYDVSDDVSGTIGVIGPTRMDYAKFMSSIEYISGALGKIFREIIR